MNFNLDQIVSQKGKIAIVTGANTGLGKEITLGLAKKEIKVIMACRNIKKAESTKTEILKLSELVSYLLPVFLKVFQNNSFNFSNIKCGSCTLS